jgi:uncharacterized protein YdeI (YjbR/CyaY-like superfamily)
MADENLLYISARIEWRNWLFTNFNKKTEVWLVYPKKSSGKIRILYNDAVEEALCFGWIDSTIKVIDKNHYKQRFTPRNPGSEYSQSNKERLKWLMENKLLHQSIEEEVKGIINEAFVFPSDIIDVIKKNKKAWNNFKTFSDSYKRIRIAYIDGARNRPEEFKKRLSNFLNKTKENKLIKGFGGIEKYY